VYGILASCDERDWVLDLGCQYGSFPSSATRASVVRLDLDAQGAGAVMADAARMPFRDAVFSAIIANHSLEHFVELDAVLHEIARVRTAGASLYVAVPDASTLADGLYRWLARGGGHVNAFTDPAETAAHITRLTGLPLAGTRLLHSGFSFANRRNSHGRPPGRLWLTGGGYEWMLRWATWLLRWCDRLFGTRSSVYGWAFYFGATGPGSVTAWPNVCIRCGAGHPAAVSSRFVYACPACGARNLRTSW
jgi:SAM-dependent methyltransferase